MNANAPFLEEPFVKVRRWADLGHKQITFNNTFWGLYRDKQVGNSGCGGTTITWVTWHRMNATSWRRNSYLLWSSKYVRRLVSIFSIMSTGKRELCSRCTLKNWTTRGWDCLGQVKHSASKLPMNFVYYSWWIVFEQNVMQTLGSTHCPISFYRVHGTICSFSNFTPVNTRFWDEEAGKLGALRGWAYALRHIYRKVTWCYWELHAVIGVQTVLPLCQFFLLQPVLNQERKWQPAMN